jgi:hypothetical protein
MEHFVPHVFFGPEHNPRAALFRSTPGRHGRGTNLIVPITSVNKSSPRFWHLMQESNHRPRCGSERSD